jgi:hypothetical protein
MRILCEAISSFEKRSLSRSGLDREREDPLRGERPDGGHPVAFKVGDVQNVARSSTASAGQMTSNVAGCLVSRAGFEPALRLVIA